MAKTTITQISDDLDGSKDASEVRFSYDGTDYVIDLSSKNKSAFDKLMKPYLAAATKVTTRKSTRSGSGKSSKRDLAAIRAWAAEQGLEVSSRGRISRSVLEAYDHAQ